MTNHYVQDRSGERVYMLADAGHTATSWCALGGLCGTFLLPRADYRPYPGE